MKDIGVQGNGKYNIPSDIERKSGLWILRAGHNRMNVRYHEGPRISENFTLYYVEQGSVVLAYDQRELIFSEGDVFCLFPHIRYRLYETNPYQHERASLHMSWITFDGELATAALDQVGIHRDTPFVRRVMKPALISLLHHIYEAMNSNEPGSEFIRQKWIYQMFELLAADPSKSKHRANWLQQSLHYMDAHYMEGITVTDVVEQAGVHRTHLYCEFIRVYGISPSHYLMKLRMERAATLLTETEVSVTEAAYSLGYSNLHTFSRAFAKYHRTSPTAYRR
ncbi:hypothetical protein JCM10914A_07130 [Paenibacillus sp. JCM 10914]|uniref:helix-turn-helix transcriptional regulator n=1 Tax=Paenibacillus sp. JCM 10914 TaxID=1236974 RepID=UPI0003CC656D|nr:AraC family transcriptional regulator [Paenibacillus sp. JCM 10914]GAE05783.1 transcriptional regulator, AraC family [Paenibacillus sp. JCM 10914]